MNEAIGQFLERGGICMYPLLVFAFAALAIGVYRSVALVLWRWLPVGPGQAFSWKEKIRAILASGESAPGLSRLETIEVLLARLEDSLSRGMLSLRFLAQTSSLLGFMGTVMGMVKTFDQVSQKGTVSPNELAGGIHEALYTTLFGLAIAIIAWSFAFLIEGLTRHHVRRIEAEIALTISRGKAL